MSSRYHVSVRSSEYTQRERLHIKLFFLSDGMWQTNDLFWTKWLQIYCNSMKNQDIRQVMQPTFRKYELCLLIQTLICSSALLWLCLRPAEIGGTGPPLSNLQGDAVSQDAGWQPGPYATAEGDPWWQSSNHHHWRQCFCLLSHPEEGQLSHIHAHFGAAHTCTCSGFVLRTQKHFWDLHFSLSCAHLGNLNCSHEGHAKLNICKIIKQLTQSPRGFTFVVVIQLCLFFNLLCPWEKQRVIFHDCQ